MSPYRILGIVLLVLGVALLIVGLNASDSVGDQVSEAFTGKYTDSTMWYLIGGAVAGVAGLALMMFGVNKRST
jgi:uncharacterized membrane protein